MKNIKREIKQRIETPSPASIKRVRLGLRPRIKCLLKFSAG
uniref:Uncharacterized protein n=1 Tax=Anguilla anguilla TaxID=7936 RepID=A0A0E9R5I8_ANGAN